ncbi:MAG: hypothetical protein ACR2MU_00730, partial [Gaiellaceae bacterium]
RPEGTSPLSNDRKDLDVGLAGPAAVVVAVVLMQHRLRATASPGLIEDCAVSNLERGNPLEQSDELHPEVIAFARWFAEWWLRRGCELLAAAEADEDREAA